MGAYWGGPAESPGAARGDEILSNANILFSVQFPHLWFVEWQLKILWEIFSHLLCQYPSGEMQEEM